MILIKTWRLYGLSNSLLNVWISFFLKMLQILLSLQHQRIGTWIFSENLLAAWSILLIGKRIFYVLWWLFRWIKSSLCHFFNRPSIWFSVLQFRHFVSEAHLYVFVFVAISPGTVEVIIHLRRTVDWWRLHWYVSTLSNEASCCFRYSF